MRGSQTWVRNAGTERLPSVIGANNLGEGWMGQIREENNEVQRSNIEALGCKRSKELGFSRELIVCFLFWFKSFLTPM